MSSKALRQLIQKQNEIKSNKKVTPVKNTTSLVIYNKLNSLFYVKNKEDEDRKGLHASAIIKTDAEFCYREQVLSLFFKRDKNQRVEPRLMRIFAEGNVIHEKWQKMFERAKVAKAIEERGYSKLFDLYMTPDAIIELNGLLYVVEIKSCSTKTYKSFLNSHPGGSKQLQLYMHFYCIPRGFVLCEDKNTQEHKEFLVEYEPETVRPYLEKLYNINRMKERFENIGKLPQRKCEDKNCKKAKECPLRGACFNINRISIGSDYN